MQILFSSIAIIMIIVLFRKTFFYYLSTYLLIHLLINLFKRLNCVIRILVECVMAIV